VHADNFMSKIERTADGCWQWLGAQNKEGYAQFSDGTHNWYVHRYMWALIGRELLPDMHIDHLCSNRSCVNPSHLEQVTPAVNHERRNLGQRMTHCYRGHEYSPENTYTSPYSGHRTCRECKRATDRARRAQRLVLASERPVKEM